MVGPKEVPTAASIMPSPKTSIMPSPKTAIQSVCVRGFQRCVGLLGFLSYSGVAILGAQLSLGLFDLCVQPAYAGESVDQEDDADFSWLDPDKKVYVLQNRKYRKAGKPAVFLGGGLDLNNPFRSGYFGTARGAFWATEQFGAEFFYSGFKNSDNATLTALKNNNSASLPYVREVRGYFGGVAAWAPFYGKLNLFNKILYYDWFINLGLAQVSTANDRNRLAAASANYVYENYLGFIFGTGQDFFITRHFSIRWDLIGLTYSATGADDNVRRFYSWNFGTSLGYHF